MDINDMRSLTTVFAFVAFMGIVFWAYSGRRKQDFDAAAMLAVEDDSSDVVPTVASPKKERN